jgi:hypothetical protein
LPYAAGTGRIAVARSGCGANLRLLCISIDIFVEQFQQLVPTGIADSFRPGYGEWQFSQ